jgi:hypothetical protein
MAEKEESVKAAELSEHKNEPDPKIIALLNRVLKRAEKGEILSVAVAYVDTSPRWGSYTMWMRHKDELILASLLDICRDKVKSYFTLRQPGQTK